MFSEQGLLGTHGSSTVTLTTGRAEIVSDGAAAVLQGDILSANGGRKPSSFDCLRSILNLSCVPLSAVRVFIDPNDSGDRENNEARLELRLAADAAAQAAPYWDCG